MKTLKLSVVALLAVAAVSCTKNKPAEEAAAPAATEAAAPAADAAAAPAADAAAAPAADAAAPTPAAH